MKLFDHQSGVYMEREGARIYYEVLGGDKAPVLLVLHGGFGNLEDFNAILPGLTQRFRVIGVDSRGQGRSTLGSVALTYEHIQKDVECILAHLKVDACSILGFSDGGIVGYRLAAFTSLKITQLVAIGSSWHYKTPDSLRGVFSKITGESWRKKFPATYEAYEKLNPEPNFDLLADAMIKMWLDPSPSGHPGEAVKNIHCPLLIIRGDNDFLFPKADALELTGIVSGSMFLNIPEAGHVAYEDQKAFFMAGLNDFFDEA